ncbi:hypothetical protein BH24ACT15_BH24ACT15_28840 [soil metagenome]
MDDRRRDQTLRRLAWLAFAVSLTIVLAGLVLLMLSRHVPRPEDDQLALTLVLNQIDYLVVPFLALLITSRRPRNAVGWLIVSASVGQPLFDGAEVYARWSLADHGGGLPGTVVAAWLTNWIWALTVVIPIYLFLLYPTGRPPSRRWRWLVWAALIHTVVMVAALMFTPGPIESFPQIDNPVGLDVLPAVPASGGGGPLLGLLFVAMTVLMAAAFASMVVRYRNAGPVERHQIRWLLFAGGVFLTTQLIGYEVLPFVVAEALTTLSSIGFTAAIAVAILRYRLFEIDRIINRTVTYGLVTAVLVAVYALVATVPAALFDLQSDLLVAGATLVAAAASGPVRRRVQALVDRRFNRTGYDAAQVADAFATRLRDEVDLEELTGDLRRVVATTVQPTHVSLWLHDPEAAR